MAGTEHEAQGAAHEHGVPVPKFLLLAYLVIGSFFVYYIVTGLKFGADSPTGF